jgi:hypothetical protein
MFCRMPVLNLPDEFVRSNDTGNNRDGTAVATLHSDKTNRTANLYVGFTLDNLPTYRNISKSNPRITFRLVPLRIEFDHSSVVFDPSKEKTLIIRGTGFSKGCSKNDYFISVSTGNCTVDDETEFSDNLITCRPPQTKPQTTQQQQLDTLNSFPADTASLCRDDKTDSFPVVAQVGSDRTNRLFVYCVQYKNPEQLPVPLIVGLTVGLGSAIIIIVIVIVVVVVLRMKRNKLPTSREHRRAGGRQATSISDYKREIRRVSNDYHSRVDVLGPVAADSRSTTSIQADRSVVIANPVFPASFVPSSSGGDGFYSNNSELLTNAFPSQTPPAAAAAIISRDEYSDDDLEIDEFDDDDDGEDYVNYTVDNLTVAAVTTAGGPIRPPSAVGRRTAVGGSAAAAARRRTVVKSIYPSDPLNLGLDMAGPAVSGARPVQAGREGELGVAIRGRNQVISVYPPAND